MSLMIDGVRVTYSKLDGGQPGAVLFPNVLAMAMLTLLALAHQKGCEPGLLRDDLQRREAVL